MTDEFWFLLAAWFVPCGFLIALGYGRFWWRQRKRLRVPMTEKLLRGPGESLRKRLEKIEDQLSDELTMAFVLPLAFGGFIQALQHNPKPPFSHGSLWVMATVGVVAYGVICRRILRLSSTRFTSASRYRRDPCWLSLNFRPLIPNRRMIRPTELG